MKNLVKLRICISELLGFDVPLHPVPIQFISLLKGKPVVCNTCCTDEVQRPCGRPRTSVCIFQFSCGEPVLQKIFEHFNRI